MEIKAIIGVSTKEMKREVRTASTENFFKEVCKWKQSKGVYYQRKINIKRWGQRGKDGGQGVIIGLG